MEYKRIKFLFIEIGWVGRLFGIAFFDRWIYISGEGWFDLDKE